MDIRDIELVYCTRSYVTRHGAGPLPNEDDNMWYEDRTNTQHEFQGELRFARLDVESLRKRCVADSAGLLPFSLAVGHLDQAALPMELVGHYDYYSWGPTRNHTSKRSSYGRG